MNFLPRMLTGMVVSSFGFSLLFGTGVAAAADDLAWRPAEEVATRHLAPPQNGKISKTRASKKSTATNGRLRPVAEATSVGSANRQVAHQEPVRKTVAKKKTVKRSTKTRTVQRSSKKVAQASAVKQASTKSAVRPASATQGGAPWQQQRKFGLPDNRVVRTAQRTVRGSGGYETVSTGEVILEPEASEHLGDVFGDSSCSSCGDGMCGTGCGDNCGSCNWDTSCCLPFALPAVDNFTIFGGPEAFKGPADFGRNGNFGLSIGANIAGPLRRCQNIGYQLGFRYVGSNFNGNQTGPLYDDDTRSQTFVTAGIFRRASSCCPWQWGVAYDYLRDEYHYEASLSQVRIELSRMGCFGNELGVLVMQNAKEELGLVSTAAGTSPTLIDLEAQTQYLFFIRRRFDNCGEGRLWGGVSGHGDGIVGGDLRMALTGSFAVTADFNYLFSKEDNIIAQQEDSYGIGINLVWHPRCSAREAGSNPFRQLFNVASNTTFMLRRP